MEDVPKHDPEFEGEGHNGEHCGIDLLVGGHSVGVDDLLEGEVELIAVEVSGSLELSSLFLRDLMHLGPVYVPLLPDGV